ncbi:hypothetical protein [Isoptericola croceus]|uniref:hypothetical protein n=1 Tax=Isoptericola croceus TaxID=3031406 RepID=UPI0023F85553|nr:hypothetical protein [Isoptericola croceus]
MSDTADGAQEVPRSNLPGMSPTSTCLAPAGLRRVYTLAYDGAPAMGGGAHTIRIGAEMATLDQAQRALANLPRRENKPALRIESRLVGPWEVVADE